jgi:hypothetical protein
LQHTIKQRREKTDRPVARKYLLTGFVYCGGCGQPLNGATKRDHPDRPIRRTYHCRVQGDTKREKGCGGVVRNADALEHWIREAICYRLDVPDLASLLEQAEDSGDLTELVDERETLRSRLDGLTDDYADGTLDKAAYKRASERVRARLVSVEGEIEQAHRSRFNVALKAGETVKDAWLSNDDGWKRSLIGLLIDKIVVKPGLSKPFYDVDGVRARFDPELIDIEWRA